MKRPHSIPNQIPVKLGITDGIWSEVISGDLQAGDQVITRKQVN